jgi:hypothetical protein
MPVGSAGMVREQTAEEHNNELVVLFALVPPLFLFTEFWPVVDTGTSCTSDTVVEVLRGITPIRSTTYQHYGEKTISKCHY